MVCNVEVVLELERMLVTQAPPTPPSTRDQRSPQTSGIVVFTWTVVYFRDGTICHGIR